MTEETMFVYVIQCQGGKYYVGRTTRLAQRFAEHWSGSGSEWTKLYPPIRVERVIETNLTYDEGSYVKKYMHLHGIDNVRGGAYVTRELTRHQKALLTKEIREANNLCLKCGSSDHFCTQCPVRRPPPPARQGSGGARPPPPARQGSMTRRRSEVVNPPPPNPIQTSPARNRHRSASPVRMAGLSWSSDEEKRLLEGHVRGYDVSTLATYHQRTPNAIRMRLASLGIEDI